MKLNERIIQLRKQQGLTQEQLGEALGVSRQAVSKWESGQANPDVAYIIKMCELFQLSADWLLMGREPDDPAPVEQPVDETSPVPGEELAAGQEAGDGEERYCVYLGVTMTDAKLVERLFQYSWAKPAFPWDGGPITRKDAKEIIEMAPLVLCEGLTREQADTAVAVFSESSGFVGVYRDYEMEQKLAGEKAPEEQPVAQAREPLSGGAIFGLVVLGVIAGVLILSIF